MNNTWNTAIIGFGQIAHGLVDDPLMARYFAYATHAQVLKAHPRFNWVAVVDPSPQACEVARERYKVKTALSDVAELQKNCRVDVVVLATPPAGARI